MRFFSVLGFAAVAIANPLPLPAATPEAYAAAEAAPEPTAMPDPQFGGSLK
jgi:hypothetical protein